MDIIIKQPRTDKEFRDYYELRWRMLRQPHGQPQGSERDDLEEISIHLMAPIIMKKSRQQWEGHF